MGSGARGVEKHAAVKAVGSLCLRVRAQGGWMVWGVGVSRSRVYCLGLRVQELESRVQVLVREVQV